MAKKEKVNLFSQETVGCDVDSEADETPVDSCSIQNNNKTAHGPTSSPFQTLENETLRATIINDFSIVNVPSEIK